eukprot:14951518-Alexandrium_andersonii.AAC.1
MWARDSSKALRLNSNEPLRRIQRARRPRLSARFAPSGLSSVAFRPRSRRLFAKPPSGLRACRCLRALGLSQDTKLPTPPTLVRASGPTRCQLGAKGGPQGERRGGG